jgi:hypothetical protein
MNRRNVYATPHKGLRNALSQLSLLAGKTDFSNPEEIEQLYNFALDVWKLLDIHADDENAVTLANLDDRCKYCSVHDVTDHEELHAMQEKLQGMLKSLYDDSRSGGMSWTERGAEFYLSFSEFQSRYLGHIAHEERITQPLLWKYFTDEELMAQHRDIMERNPPELLLTWFRFVIPAQSPTERLEFIRGFRQMASPSFFDAGKEVIRRHLPTKEFDVLFGS